MALIDSIEFLKDDRSIRIGSPAGKTGKLRYRVIDLRSHAENDAKIEFKLAEGIIERKLLCVIELTNGEERLLIGPKKTGAKPKLMITDGKKQFKIGESLPEIHMSRLWLQYTGSELRYYLYNVRLDSNMIWSFGRDSSQPILYMDDYCKAYYEGNKL